MPTPMSLKSYLTLAALACAIGLPILFALSQKANDADVHAQTNRVRERIQALLGETRAISLSRLSPQENIPIYGIYETPGACAMILAAHAYRSVVRLLVLINAEGKIVAIDVLEADETPGYGAAVLNDAKWLEQFRHYDLSQPRRANTEDRDVSFDTVSGATLTSQRVIEMVQLAGEKYPACQRVPGAPASTLEVPQ